MLNSMVMLLFSVLDQKDPFGVNLVQKFKIVNLKVTSATKLFFVIK